MSHVQPTFKGSQLGCLGINWHQVFLLFLIQKICAISGQWAHQDLAFRWSLGWLTMSIAFLQAQKSIPLVLKKLWAKKNDILPLSYLMHTVEAGKRFKKKKKRISQVSSNFEGMAPPSITTKVTLGRCWELRTAAISLQAGKYPLISPDFALCRKPIVHQPEGPSGTSLLVHFLLFWF